MKYKIPIVLKMLPNYYIGGDYDIVHEDLEKGGFINYDGKLDGGYIDWQLGTEAEAEGYKNPSTMVQIMRLFAIQLTKQLVNDEAYVDQIRDEPKFHLTDEEKENFKQIYLKLLEGLNEALDKSNNQVVIKKKPKFNFSENDE